MWWRCSCNDGASTYYRSSTNHGSCCHNCPDHRGSYHSRHHGGNYRGHSGGDDGRPNCRGNHRGSIGLRWQSHRGIF